MAQIEALRIFGRAGNPTFAAQQEAEKYLAALPEGYTGEAHKTETGRWMASYRLVQEQNMNQPEQRDRLKPLFAFLVAHDARLLTVHSAPRSSTEYRTYLFDGRLMAIVAVYGEADGWDLYLPASTENDVTRTLEAARDFLAKNANGKGELKCRP